MNTEQIDRLALQAGFWSGADDHRMIQFTNGSDEGELARFASLIAEECAKIADIECGVSYGCGDVIREAFCKDS